jgi:hypothetical protein
MTAWRVLCFLHHTAKLFLVIFLKFFYYRPLIADFNFTGTTGLFTVRGSRTYLSLLALLTQSIHFLGLAYTWIWTIRCPRFPSRKGCSTFENRVTQKIVILGPFHSLNQSWPPRPFIQLIPWFIFSLEIIQW